MTDYTYEIPLIDPVSHAGKLRIPIELTEDTKGRQEWLRAQGHLRKDLSLCCLYQQGRCHAGQRCHQVHVDRSYIAVLRAENAGLVTCCMACGDQASAETRYRESVRGAVVAIGDAVVGAERLAKTQGLDILLQQRRGTTTITVPSGRVCRLHLRNSCKYGKDCKNVHVCSKVSIGPKGPSSDAHHQAPSRSAQEETYKSSESYTSHNHHHQRPSDSYKAESYKPDYKSESYKSDSYKSESYKAPTVDRWNALKTNGPRDSYHNQPQGSNNGPQHHHQQSSHGHHSSSQNHSHHSAHQNHNTHSKPHRQPKQQPLHIPEPAENHWIVVVKPQPLPQPVMMIPPNAGIATRNDPMAESGNTSFGNTSSLGASITSVNTNLSTSTGSLPATTTSTPDRWSALKPADRKIIQHPADLALVSFCAQWNRMDTTPATPAKDELSVQPPLDFMV